MGWSKIYMALEQLEYASIPMIKDLTPIPKYETNPSNFSHALCEADTIIDYCKKFSLHPPRLLNLSIQENKSLLIHHAHRAIRMFVQLHKEEKYSWILWTAYSKGELRRLLITLQQFPKSPRIGEQNYKATYSLKEILKKLKKWCDGNREVFMSINPPLRCVYVHWKASAGDYEVEVSQKIHYLGTNTYELIGQQT